MSFEILQHTFKRMAALRQIASIMRKPTKRTALGYGAKLRMRRMDWIKQSQEQGVVVAADRKAARKAFRNGGPYEATLGKHLNQFYPMHRHDRRAQT